MSERRTKVNPPKTRRYEPKCRQNQDRLVILGQVRQMPDDGADGDRRRGGVRRTQAFAWNCRNQALDAKGEAQAVPNREARVPMQETGADRSVRALRAL